MVEELYFCVHLTENEHYICAHDLEQECNRLGAEFVYWRKLKDGHVAMYREVKVRGTKPQINLVKKYIREQHLDEFVKRNPHKLTDEEWLQEFHHGP